MIDPSQFLYLIPTLPVIIFIGYILIGNRCPKGGFHKYKKTNSRVVMGYDIGFGITNSYTENESECEKCGDKITHTS